MIYVVMISEGESTNVLLAYRTREAAIRKAKEICRQRRDMERGYREHVSEQLVFSTIYNAKGDSINVVEVDFVE